MGKDLKKKHWEENLLESSVTSSLRDTCLLVIVRGERLTPSQGSGYVVWGPLEIQSEKVTSRKMPQTTYDTTVSIPSGKTYTE